MVSPDKRCPSVLVLAQLPPPLHGASAVSDAIAQSEELRHDFELSVVPIQMSSNLSDIGRLNLGKFAALYRMLSKTIGAYRKFRPDIVYLTLPPHGGGFYACVPIIAFLRLARAKVVYHFHGKGIAAAAERSRLYRALFRWACAKSYNIVLSERLYPDAAEFLARDRTFFLPNFGPEPKEEGISGRTGDHVLFLSNLLLAKGPMVLLEALEILDRSGVSFRATFTGIPFPPLSADSFAKEIEARGLSAKVDYVGPVYGDAKDALLRSADIFALPTFNEAFPVSMLEAMGWGIAIVATPEGAIRDMVLEGETGFLVPQQDAPALAAAIGTLLADPTRCRNMGKAGRARMAENFSRAAFFRGLGDIFRTVIARQDA